MTGPTIADLLGNPFDNPFSGRVGLAAMSERRRAAGIPDHAAGPWDAPLELAAQAREVAARFDALARA